MILKRIVVSNWRSLLKQVEVGPFAEGINVVHAPNGTGKSSLFEAMCRGLFDAHHVSGTEIAAVRPWGRDLTPSVQIEFVEGGETWRVEKSFITNKSSQLSKLVGDRFEPVADSRNADERMRAILAAEAPGRGLSKQEHWGLAQILWTPQGQLMLEGISGNVAHSIKEALGVQLSADGRTSSMEEEIARRYEELYTKTGALKRSKNENSLQLLEERKTQLLEQQETLKQQYNEFAVASRAVEDARLRRGQSHREAEALSGTVTELQGRVEAYNKLKAEQKNKRDAESLAREKYESLQQRQQQIAQGRQQQAGLTKQQESLELALEGLRKEELQAREALADCRTKRETARQSRGQLEEKHQLLEHAREYLQKADKLDSLQRRLQQIAELQEKRLQCQNRQKEVPAPTPKEIRELRQWISKRDQASVSLQASQIHLHVRPEQSVEVSDATQGTKTRIAAGEEQSFTGDSWIDLSIVGFGSIRASGPGGSSQEHRTALEEANRKIAVIARTYGTEDPEKLQVMRTQRDTLEHELQALDERMKQVLDGDDLEQWQQQQTELQSYIRETAKQFPQWEQQPPALQELQQEYEVLRKTVEGAVNAAEDAFEKVQARHNAAEQVLHQKQADLKLLQNQLESIQLQLQEWGRDGLSDRERAKAIDDALMAWQAAKVSAEQAEEGLRQFPDDPAKELARQQSRLQAQREAAASARDAEMTAEGKLQSLAAEGAYSKLIAVEEELAAVAARIAQESIRLDAIKLLYNTMMEHKRRMEANIAAPVERMASRLLDRVMGPRLGELKMNVDFVPEAIQPEIAGEPVPLANLSAGEREQLYLVTRLALADRLTQNQRQLVVLDDVLNATDSSRLARLLNLLEEFAERMQIIILTCHPERYRSLEQANFLDLEQILAST